MDAPAPLERRRFLALSAAGAVGAAALPAWLASAFGACGPADPSSELARAFDTARYRGRPLLVLIVPETSQARWCAGHAWGQLLTHCSDEFLACLALCEVVCTRERPMRTALRDRVSLPEDIGRAVLVETDGSGLRSLACSGAWETIDLEPPTEREDSGYHARYTVLARERMESLAAELRSAILGDAGALERRMRACVRALGLDLDAIWRGGLPAAAMSLDRAVREAPALVLWGAGRWRRPSRIEAIEALSHSVARRLRVGAPAGTRWMLNGSCSEDPELEEPCPPDAVCTKILTACGMGHVPPGIACRFLEFFTA